MLAKIGVVISAYVAMGRTGAIASCLLFEGGLLMTFVMSLLLDLVQIPVYGLLLEASARPNVSGRKISTWIDHRRQKLVALETKSTFWAKIMRFKPLAIMAVAIIPIRGCGIISACILTFMLGYNRLHGTLLIMAGSVIGALLTIGILFEPIRLTHGL